MHRTIFRPGVPVTTNAACVGRVHQVTFAETVFITEKAPKPVGPYNQALKVGNFLFVSGQLAIDPKEEKIVVKDVTLQTRQVMKHPPYYTYHTPLLTQ